MEPLTTPQQEIRFEVGPNTYKLSFPNLGQYISIENRKAAMSLGNYDILDRTPSGLIAKMNIDMVALFSVMVPDLGKDLNSKTLLDLPLDKSNELFSIYVETILPWFNEWMAIFSKVTSSTKVAE